MANPAQFFWLDENGTKTKGIVHIGDGVVDPGTLSPFALVLQACSNAKLGRIGILIDEVYAGTLGTGAYDAEDKAVLDFEDADGRTCKVVVPAPKDGMFKADDKTVDPAAGIVDDLITEVLVFVITAGGAALVRFIKGRRSRRNRAS